MSKQELTYEEYNKLSFAVRGDKKKYAKKLKDIGGRWNPRMKGGEGWLVPKENLENLKNLLTEVNISTESEITQIKSRKNQNKYRREVSDIEEVSSLESELESESVSGSDSDSSSDSKETGKILLNIENKILPVKSDVSESDDEKEVIDPVKTEIINDQFDQVKLDKEQHFIERKKFEDEKRAFELQHKKSTKQIESTHEQLERPNGDKKCESRESRERPTSDKQRESNDQRGRESSEQRGRDKQRESSEQRGRESNEQRGRDKQRESSEQRGRDKQRESSEQRGRESNEQRGRDKQRESNEQRGRESSEQRGRDKQRESNEQRGRDKQRESTEQRGRDKQRESSEQRGRSNDKRVCDKQRESTEQRGRTNEKNMQKTSDTKNVIKYYKSFSNKPSAFKEMYESDDNNKFSSSDCGDSSSDDFPYPNSPKKKAYKRDDDDYGTLFGKVNELQKRLYHVELKQKKKTER
jgi:hypothetical protein